MSSLSHAKLCCIVAAPSHSPSLTYAHAHTYTRLKQNGFVVYVILFLAFAVFAEFSFTCVIDLTSALEYDGIISGFMEFYQKTVC